MEKFTRLEAIAVPLAIANVNTDDIYPGPGASPVSRSGQSKLLRDRKTMGINAFAAVRWNDDLSPKAGFILNQPRYAEAGILIARENFGCGSSREMAVWALQGIGLRCIIAPSFGDIFYNNCFKNGVLAIRLPTTLVEELLDLAASTVRTFVVDLEAMQLTTPNGHEIAFEVGEYHRETLLLGLDEIAATLKRMPVIETRERVYFEERPWLA
jgi:3-isopropylmalate/(R)-2-methylmalate dehydratase small subunit